MFWNSTLAILTCPICAPRSYTFPVLKSNDRSALRLCVSCAANASVNAMHTPITVSHNARVLVAAILFVIASSPLSAYPRDNSRSTRGREGFSDDGLGKPLPTPYPYRSSSGSLKPYVPSPRHPDLQSTSTRAWNPENCPSPSEKVHSPRPVIKSSVQRPTALFPFPASRTTLLASK